MGVFCKTVIWRDIQGFQSSRTQGVHKKLTYSKGLLAADVLMLRPAPDREPNMLTGLLTHPRETISPDAKPWNAGV
jgi:hypothetical protein